jgi:hypothetical protein
LVLAACCLLLLFVAAICCCYLEFGLEGRGLQRVTPEKKEESLLAPFTTRTLHSTSK